MPVVLAGSQSTLPQAQADGLAEEPSVMAQVGNWLHLFWDRSQCMPVAAAVSQSTLPHAQADGLAEEPSIEIQQYCPAIDPLLTPLNIKVLLAMLSTQAGAQNGA